MNFFDNNFFANPEIKEIQSFIINNGINVDLFPQNVQKVKNTFIYTSGSFRGLKRLMELWEDILLKLPDAKLYIASYEDFPKDEEDILINKSIEKNNIGPDTKILIKLEKVEENSDLFKFKNLEKIIATQSWDKKEETLTKYILILKEQDEKSNNKHDNKEKK